MKKLLLSLFLLMPLVSSAQLINFKWDETGRTQSGYSPGITIHEGESYQLKFTTSPITNNVFEDPFNWVYYDFAMVSSDWEVVDESGIFAISPDGIVTGKNTGLGAIKGTGFVKGANDRFYIEVIPEEEQEPNDEPEQAVKLGSRALPFKLSSMSDVDWFKVSANVGDEIVIKVSSKDTPIHDYLFHVETYDSSMDMINSFNQTIGTLDPSFEVQVRTITRSGTYYIKFSFISNPILFYGGDLTIQAFKNGNPISGVIMTNCPDTENIIYYNLNGFVVDPNNTKG